MNNEFNDDWKNWIKTNVSNGQDKNGLFKILLDEGFAFDAIAQEMNFIPTLAVDLLVNPFKLAEQKQINARKYNKARVNNYGAAIDSNNVCIPNAKNCGDQKLDIFCLDDFLNEVECQHLVSSIKSKLKPSSLSSYETDENYRTSQTCELSVLSDKLIKDIDSRICSMLGIHVSYSEAIQGQYYERGQQFKAHTDFFEENEMETHGGIMGQRTFTCMIYLNEVEEGGETHFPKVGAKFRPKRGMAVIWNSLYSDGSTNTNSMHQALPVLKGNKAIITKWFRSNSSLSQAPSMFREAN